MYVQNNAKYVGRLHAVKQLYPTSITDLIVKKWKSQLNFQTPRGVSSSTHSAKNRRTHLSITNFDGTLQNIYTERNSFWIYRANKKKISDMNWGVCWFEHQSLIQEVEQVISSGFQACLKVFWHFLLQKFSATMQVYTCWT